MIQTFSITASPSLKQRTFFWTKSFPFTAYLDSNQYPHDIYSRFETLIAVGSTNTAQLSIPPTSSKKNQEPFEQLYAFQQKAKGWLFGYLAYDLKNNIEKLDSRNYDGLQFPDLHFFEASIRIIFKNNHELVIESQDIAYPPAFVYQQILQIPISNDLERIQQPFSALQFKHRLSYTAYLAKVEQIKQDILKGNIYEANFCQEVYAENSKIDPYPTFWQLNQATKAPFSAFLKLNHHFALSISPERYLQKKGNRVISQPIKGTIRRGINAAEDQQLQEELQQSAKDRSENVMIVDLVRNDLSKLAAWGTVNVEELYGVYGFSAVSHLISTISAQIQEQYHFADILKASFPMGSMTGTPKIAAMQLIEHYEVNKRGLYSGAIGYISPDGDFDFNVVIRTLLYNKNYHYISLQAGGAITAESDPQKEYEECLLKSQSLTNALQHNKINT